MGTKKWDSTDWNKYTTTTATKSTDEIFTSRGLHADMNPMGVTLRESRDSENHPESIPIIVGIDVTGSMGILAEKIVREGLGTLFNEILDRKPVPDPQLMSIAIGDAQMFDKAPLQISQFESDLKCADWLEKIYIEGNGGGNQSESYDLPYYFAATRTSTDSFEKRGQKGFIFTIGDENPPEATTVKAIKKVLDKNGDGLEADIPFKEVLEMAEKMYHCFHIIIAEGYHASRYPDQTKSNWQELLGQRAIWLKDYTKLAETLVSLIQVVSGEDKAEIVKSWSGDTSLVVADAIKDVEVSDAFERGKEVIRF